MFGSEALLTLLNNYSFSTVLDIGCGTGEQATIFRDNNKVVTEIDFGNSWYTTKRTDDSYIVGDYLKTEFKNKFDLLWVCHVLEHQKNINSFLNKLFLDVKDNGIIAITVPPKKDYIVGGHINLWNAGLLLYNLVIAGFDCSDARIKQYGYNISIILYKKEARLPKLSSDCGDIEKLKQFFPKACQYRNSKNELILEGFNGYIKELNWK